MTLEHLAHSLRAVHSSLWRVRRHRRSTIATGVYGVPFIGPGMELSALCPVDRARPIAALAEEADVRSLRSLEVHHSNGELGAMLLLGWSDACAPSEQQVLCRFTAVLPALQALIEHPVDGNPGVLVLHEDELVAQGIARRLEAASGLDVVASSDPEHLETTLAHDRPWIVVCSDHLDGAPLGEVACRARRARGDVRVVALASARTPASIENARAAKADGYATVEPDLERLIDTINAVHAGVATPLPEPQGAVLTKREQQLLQGLEEGLTYQEIALRLGVTLATVKTQSRPLFRKLDVCSRAAAVHKARAQGLL